MKGADKGFWCWACKLLSKQSQVVVRGGIKWGEVVRLIVAASANCGQDPQRVCSTGDVHSMDLGRALIRVWTPKIHSIPRPKEWTMGVLWENFGENSQRYNDTSLHPIARLLWWYMVSLVDSNYDFFFISVTVVMYDISCFLRYNRITRDYIYIYI